MLAFNNFLSRAAWLAVAALYCCDWQVHATEPRAREIDAKFSDLVQPFLNAYCLDCHGQQKQEAKLDLSGLSTGDDAATTFRVWQLVLERLQAEEMPPDDAPKRPTTEERAAVVQWIRSLKRDLARRHAGDPGEVPLRRLSNFEIDCTIRDLTGVDLRPTREFPVDPANEAGFDNSGESLTVSPAWFKKWLASARLVADHLVLKPNGFAFAPHPVVSDTDRDKYCVARIVDFYRNHAVDYTDYFLVAWRFAHRDVNGKQEGSLDGFAADASLSAKYAAMVWSALTESNAEAGPLAELQAMWRELPANAGDMDAARRGCQRMRDFVIETRKQFVKPVDKLRVKGISDGSQPLVLWRNRQIAAGRMRSNNDDESAVIFGRTFPDAFAISERPPYFEPNGGTKGRLLTAGFHLMQGYFRDDQPLCELVLTDAEKQELDALWQELNFITDVPSRQYKDFIFFERAEPPRFAIASEFDFARSEDKDATSAAKIERMRSTYLAKAREIGASDQAMNAIDQYFTTMAADIRWVENARLAAEPSHLAAFDQFAQRAYRRPLSPSERDELRAFYRSLRDADGLDHESALRDCIASVLASPQFCYLDLASGTRDRTVGQALGERSPTAADGGPAPRLAGTCPTLPAGETPAPQHAAGETPAPQVQRLSDYELASRLSYFLWSSVPDEQLLKHAAGGDLHQPDVLAEQSQRMLQDARVEGLAIQFAGSLLDFRRFSEHNAVDRERFASFTDELRQAMYDEALRFLVHLLNENCSVLDLLYGDYTFVNAALARHYGMPVREGQPNEWIRVDDAGRYGRGGLLAMAVFLTKNSPGLRTSPVKRGYWVVRRLLGERIPSPPPSVPELPKDEAQLGELTLPQLLARHREQKSCAACHERFDSLGLVFEGYGPIGERRDRDLAGHVVSEIAVFRDGSQGAGVDGLRDYLRRCRQEEFIDNICRKLLVYALGRTLLPSDELLVDNMRKRLAADEYRFGSLVESIVTSPQFLNKRVLEK